MIGTRFCFNLLRVIYSRKTNTYNNITITAILSDELQIVTLDAMQVLKT